MPPSTVALPVNSPLGVGGGGSSELPPQAVSKKNEKKKETENKVRKRAVANDKVLDINIGTLPCLNVNYNPKVIRSLCQKHANRLSKAIFECNGVV